MNNHHEAPDGKRVFLWSGRDRKSDTENLMKAIATAVPGLFERDGVIFQLNGHGELTQINRADLGTLIDRHVCTVHVVNRDGKWVKEYTTFEFGPPPPRGTYGEKPHPNQPVPDLFVLDDIYRNLHLTLPKARG
jgi:hypothetical protein